MSELKAIEIIVCFLLIMSAIGFGVAFGKIDILKNQIKLLAEPEIIRCKDCKWLNDIGCAIRIVDDTDKPSENDYCSFAERKDNE